MAEVRTFESNVDAFEYACEHLDCSLKEGRPAPAIVLGVHGRMCAVKVASPEDRTIPAGTLNELLARTDLTHVCFSAMLADNVPQVQVGDLVMYSPMPELAAAGKALVAGTVVSRLDPHYSSKTGWQVHKPEPRNPPPQPEPQAPGDSQ